jgi:beclin 1
MIVASLPPSPSGQERYASEAERLAHLPTPAAVKAAWQRSQRASASSQSPSTLSSRAQGKQPQKTSPLPNESFVLLQDSVVRNIPSSPAPHLAKKTKKSPAVAATAKSRAPESNPQQAAAVEPDDPNPSPLSHHLRSTLRLFNLLSTRTDIDHPLCAECAQILLSSLQRQLDETKRERDGYIAFEKEVRKEKEKEGLGMSKVEAEKKIEKLKGEERMAIEQLKEAERERAQLEADLKALEVEEKALEAEEAE